MRRILEYVPQVNLAVIWVKTDYTQPVPGWVVALAVLAGLLLLALLIFVMYKVREDMTSDCTRLYTSNILLMQSYLAALVDLHLISTYLFSSLII